MSDYKNEDGEWLMDAAAIRLEQHIDEMDAYDRAMDYDEYGPDEDDEGCEECGEPEDDHDRSCSVPVEKSYELNGDWMEDQWLDGSYED